MVALCATLFPGKMVCRGLFEWAVISADERHLFMGPYILHTRIVILVAPQLDGLRYEGWETLATTFAQSIMLASGAPFTIYVVCGALPKATMDRADNLNWGLG
jgi:hypothetical protein